jgi:hypothetical protein
MRAAVAAAARSMRIHYQAGAWLPANNPTQDA